MADTSWSILSNEDSGWSTSDDLVPLLAQWGLASPEAPPRRRSLAPLGRDKAQQPAAWALGRHRLPVEVQAHCISFLSFGSLAALMPLSRGTLAQVVSQSTRSSRVGAVLSDQAPPAAPVRLLDRFFAPFQQNALLRVEGFTRHLVASALEPLTGPPHVAIVFATAAWLDVLRAVEASLKALLPAGTVVLACTGAAVRHPRQHQWSSDGALLALIKVPYEEDSARHRDQLLSAVAWLAQDCCKGVGPSQRGLDLANLADRCGTIRPSW
uniref:Uncharacterized protein n=1 Tax=Rhizochromulina marina TaxID=1034831 RepID=A0A7S2WSL6_9STRA|mmetsp:Transcript_32053/g.93093  ORF Transcript_32053/g.93093 Transcript_32053/m.93093 type:complete len:268 (+) Transcript_32053:90-893(+)